MAGTPQNAAVWTEGAVYVAFDLEATIPADIDTPFGVEWDAVGLLDGDAGFAFEREIDRTNHHAWGAGVIKTTRRNETHTVTFTAVESPDANETVYRLAWPGSTDSVIKLPGKNVESVLVGFEVTEGDRRCRYISYYRAEIEPDGAITLNESDLSNIPFRVTVYADGSDNLYHRQVSGVDVAS